MRYPVIIFLLCFSHSYAGIGHINTTINDASRNRNIETEIYYPAASNGDNVPVMPGQYPLLVWGHGFVMSTNAYMNIVNVLVDDGYIVALPKTEGGIIPNHQEFAKDLLFLVNYLTETENTLSSSILYQSFNSLAAIGGHSMGGGCSILAAQMASGNMHVKTVVNFAAANTNPSAINAAAGVPFPTLMFAGANDCITPIADHQQPIFDALSAACKVLVTLNGASHCYFADSSLTCSLGEITCNPSAAITRSEQHTRTFNILKPWLDIYLKAAGESAVNDIKEVWSNSSYYQKSDQCATLNIIRNNEPAVAIIKLSDGIYQIVSPIKMHYELIDVLGKRLDEGSFTNSTTVDLSNKPNGCYFIILIDDANDKITRKLVR